VPECNNLFKDLPNQNTSNGEQISVAASSMIRTHSVAGDLHGVPPDPVAADILRKEPEDETFVRLNISPNGILLCFSCWRMASLYGLINLPWTVLSLLCSDFHKFINFLICVR